MRRICSVCWHVTSDDQSGVDTHGVCEGCRDWFFERIPVGTEAEITLHTIRARAARLAAEMFTGGPEASVARLQEAETLLRQIAKDLQPLEAAFAEDRPARHGRVSQAEHLRAFVEANKN